MLHALRCIGDLADIAPSLLVVGDDEFIHARRHHVAGAIAMAAIGILLETRRTKT